MDSDQDENDAALFQQAMRHVTPIKPSGRVAHRLSPAMGSALRPSPAQQLRRERAVSHGSASAPLSDALLHQDQDMMHSYRVNGLAADALRRLRKESRSVRASLDLHGLNIEEARSTLYSFIQACFQHGYKRIRIIHGQGFGSSTGTAILKHQTRHWLSQIPEVLGYVSAPATDGGDGAVLVLLRTPQVVNQVARLL